MIKVHLGASGIGHARHHRTIAVMPVEPPPSRWRIPTPRRTDTQGLVGLGADLEPGTVLAAYRTGSFPMPVEGALAWFSPDPRTVIPLVSPPATRERGADDVAPHLRRSLRRARRRFEIRVDSAFDDVLAGCADPRRPGGWITPAMGAAYRRLHQLGWVHTVEAWTSGGQLAGGLFGVAVGGLFAAESMFHAVTDGSKAALAGLLELLESEDDAADRVLDVQWTSAHLATLGAVEIPRAHYLRRLGRAVTLAPPAAFVPRM